MYIYNGLNIKFVTNESVSYSDQLIDQFATFCCIGSCFGSVPI